MKLVIDLCIIALCGSSLIDSIAEIYQSFGLVGVIGTAVVCLVITAILFPWWMSLGGDWLNQLIDLMIIFVAGTGLSSNLGWIYNSFGWVGVIITLAIVIPLVIVAVKINHRKVRK